MKTARVHHAARRRGGDVAARGARAAARAGAAHRRAPARSRGRSGMSGPRRGVPAGAGSYWAGPSAATCGSTRAGPQPMPTTFADTRRNWPRSRRTSSWPMAAQPWGRCCRRPAPCRSCFRSSAIRSAAASSTAWRGRAATPPDFMIFEFSLSGKWLELLKQIAPSVTRAAVLRDPAPRLRNQPVCRHPGRGAVAQGGGQPGQHARRRRDRARRRGLRARVEWRPDRDGGAGRRSFIAI